MDFILKARAAAEQG